MEVYEEISGLRPMRRRPSWRAAQVMPKIEQTPTEDAQKTAKDEPRDEAVRGDGANAWIPPTARPAHRPLRYEPFDRLALEWMDRQLRNTCAMRAEKAAAFLNISVAEFKKLPIKKIKLGPAKQATALYRMSDIQDYLDRCAEGIWP